MSRGSSTLNISVGRPSTRPGKGGSVTADYDLTISVRNVEWRVNTKSFNQFMKLNSALKSILKKIGSSNFPANKKKVTKKNASSIWQRKREDLERWIKEIAQDSTVFKHPQFIEFCDIPADAKKILGIPTDESESESSKPSARPSGSQQPGGKTEDDLAEKYQEAMTLLEKEKEEHEKTKAHTRRVSVNFESTMMAFEELKTNSAAIQEQHEGTLESLNQYKEKTKTFQSKLKKNQQHSNQDTKKLYEMENVVNDLMKDTKELRKLNEKLEQEVQSKADQVSKIEGKMETLQMNLRKLEREKTDSDIQRIELTRRLEHQRMLQSDPDNIQTIVSHLEKENSLLRQAQLLNQLFIDEKDPVLIAANEKIQELETTLAEIIEDKKTVIVNFTEDKNKEMLRMTEEFSQSADHVVQTEILVLRKQLINKEMQLNEIANQRALHKKTLEQHVYKKYKEKLSTIRNEMMRRLDKVKLEIHNLITNNSSFMDEQDKEITSDREVLRLRRIILDKENHINRLKLDIDSNEEDHQIDKEQLQAESDNLKAFFSAEKEGGESAGAALLKKQVMDSTTEIKEIAKKLEQEKKNSQIDKNRLESEIKQLHIEFEDLTNSSTRRVHQLKLEMQKNENEFFIFQQRETHEKEDVEDLHRNFKAVISELEQLKREKKSSRYLENLIDGIQLERDNYLEQLKNARSSKIRLIQVFSNEIENMRDELKQYQLAGYKKDPTQRNKSPPQEENYQPRQERAHTVDITTNISRNEKYEESAYAGLGLDSMVLKPPPVIEDL